MQEKIAGVLWEIDRRMDRLPGILKEDGYPDVQAFKRTYDAAILTPLFWSSTFQKFPNMSVGQITSYKKKNIMQLQASVRTGG